MNNKHTFRKPDSLLLLALVVTVGMLVSTGTSAAETLFSKATLSELIDGNMKLAPVGHRGGLHMTFKSPSREHKAVYVSHADNGYSSKDKGVHLSFQMPW